MRRPAWNVGPGDVVRDGRIVSSARRVHRVWIDFTDGTYLDVRADEYVELSRSAEKPVLSDLDDGHLE